MVSAPFVSLPQGIFRASKATRVEEKLRTAAEVGRVGMCQFFPAATIPLQVFLASNVIP